MKTPCLLLAIACACLPLLSNAQPMEALIDGQFKFAAKQYKVLARNTPPDKMPKTWYEREQSFSSASIYWWVSGFFPASLFYIYEHTKDKAILEEALQRLEIQKPIQNYTGNHDLGFMVFCPFGNAYRITGNPEYQQVIHRAAASLATRFRPEIQSFQSWDHNAHFNCPVIIDNMMNLELLYWVSNDGGDAKYRDMAISHANATLERHYRPDYSSWHVLDYDLQTGQLVRRATWQGMADTSAWSRGQAWGLYGFVMMYRFAKDARYLEQAKNIARFLMDHPNLPADKIPYWDYDAKGDISVLRDASAAAITASALLELATFVDGKVQKIYLEHAETILRSLSSPKYRAKLGENGGFLLKHSVGALPLHNEIDVPLTYADYYFLEALHRYKNWFLVKKGND